MVDELAGPRARRVAAAQSRAAALALPVLTLLTTLLVSCAAPGAQIAPLGDPDVLTRDEIDDSSARTAYELVQSLRPQWLITRGQRSLQQPAEASIVIYLDNARLGAPDSMQGVALGAVRYLRFFSAPEATLRWGGGHVYGAILISTQNRREAPGGPVSTPP